MWWKNHFKWNIKLRFGTQFLMKHVALQYCRLFIYRKFAKKWRTVGRSIKSMHQAKPKKTTISGTRKWTPNTTANTFKRIKSIKSLNLWKQKVKTSQNKMYVHILATWYQQNDPKIFEAAVKYLQTYYLYTCSMHLKVLYVTYVHTYI